MYRTLIVALVLMCCSPLLLAQDPPEDRGGDPPAGDRERGPRDRGPGDRGRRGGGPGRMMERLVRSLDLDEEQQAELERIMVDHQSRMEEVAPLLEEIREARRSGDRERARQLRDELPVGLDPEDSMRQAMDELEPILNEEQYDRFAERRQRMEEFRQERQAQRKLVRELPEELDLDENQRAQFSEMLDSFRRSRRDQMRQMRPVLQQLREAQDACDDEKVAELDAQLRASMGDPRAQRAKLLEDVKGILREEQVSRLETYQLQLEAEMKGEVSAEQDVRVILRLARRVKLNPDQLRQWKTIARDVMKNLRTLKRKDKEAAHDLARGTKAQLIALMNAEQIERFEKQLERAKARGR